MEDTIREDALETSLDSSPVKEGFQRLLKKKSPNKSPIEEKKEYTFKILIIGEPGTGKTSIIKRYVHQYFTPHYKATIGVDFALKVVNFDPNTMIRMQLWDIAGQERFGNMTRVYYKAAVGALIVFDVTRTSTFDAVRKWKEDLDSKVHLSDGSRIPCVLLANKRDCMRGGVRNATQIENYCRRKGFSGWFETSAKENINIDTSMNFLLSKILERNTINLGGSEDDEDRIVLNSKKNKSIRKRCC